MKLGLMEDIAELRDVQYIPKINERAFNACYGDVVTKNDVIIVQGEGPMQGNVAGSAPSMRCGDVDAAMSKPVSLQRSPVQTGGGVTQCRTRATRKYSCHPLTFACGHRAVADRIHATMHGKESAGEHSLANRGTADPDCRELSGGHQTVLILGKAGDFEIPGH